MFFNSNEKPCFYSFALKKVPTEVSSTRKLLGYLLPLVYCRTFWKYEAHNVSIIKNTARWTRARGSTELLRNALTNCHSTNKFESDYFTNEQKVTQCLLEENCRFNVFETITVRKVFHSEEWKTWLDTRTRQRECISRKFSSDASSACVHLAVFSIIETLCRTY